MASKRILGLVSIRIGDIAGDGGMGTNLTAIGDTVIDSAVVSNTEGTKTDFNIEEQDDPVESIISTPGAYTAAWSTYNVNPNVMAKLFGGTVTTSTTGLVATLGTVVGGSGYSNATYTDVPLTGGSGAGARATIVVAGGAVTSVTITSKGSGYTVANSLSANNEHLGGAGTGFSVPVATIQTGGAKWAAPATIPDIEKSIEIVDKKTNRIEIARAKLTATLALNFQKTNLGQVNISATVLTPTKSGVPSLQIFTYAD